MLNSIKARLTAFTVLISLTITLLTVSFFYVMFQSILMKNMIQSTEFGLQMTMNTISENMNQVIYLSDWANHAEFIYHFLVSDSDNKSAKLNAYHRLKEEYSTTKVNDYILRFMIGNQKGNFIQEVKIVSDGSTMDYKKITESDFFHPLLSAEQLTFIGLVKDPGSTEERLIIPILRPIYNRYNASMVGWTYLTISSSLLTDALDQYPIPEDSTLYITFGGKTYEYADKSFREIPDDALPETSSNPEDKRTISGLYEGTRVQKITDSVGNQHTIISYPSSIDGWYLTQSLSTKEFNAQKRTYYLLLFVIVLVSLSLGILLTFLLNHIINQPIKQLQKKMNEISHGDFSYDSSIEWENEFGEIGKGINTLSTNVVNLMENRIQAEKQQKELEYQILQSQVNPHFLYNTLNSIKWMATIQNATGIAEMTTALSRLLKSISKGTRQIIPVREELELLKNYVLIQQYRYGGIVAVTYDIEEAALDCLIPKFTLQPLVENAMFHGVEAKGSNGEVHIRMFTEPDPSPVMRIEITDNGIGMSEDLIQKVLSGEQQEEASHDFFRKIGINNVNKRIQFCFGERYGITIESEVGVYTKMKIILPYSNSI